MERRAGRLISYINWKVKVKSLSRVRPLATPWTVARQAPPSMEFSRQEYWSVRPFPAPGDLPQSGIEPAPPALAGRFFTSEPPGKPNIMAWVTFPRVWRFSGSCLWWSAISQTDSICLVNSSWAGRKFDDKKKGWDPELQGLSGRTWELVSLLETIVSILPTTLSVEVGDREEMVSRECISQLHTLGIQTSWISRQQARKGLSQMSLCGKKGRQPSPV